VALFDLDEIDEEHDLLYLVSQMTDKEARAFNPMTYGDLEKNCIVPLEKQTS
jgi:hypothetical protein